MKQFSKLALLLGFMSVIGLHGQPVWASSASSSSSCQADAQFDFEAEPETIRSMMTTYFSDDHAPSPLSGTDAGSQLVNTVAGYMRAGNGETLHRLFYKPDVNAWSTLYQQVTRGQEFSALNLVTFLDQTKTNLFNDYKGVKRIVDGEAYLYVATLFDNAMQQIFTGCWGFSDKPTPTNVINHLKGVYGRVVSDLLPVMGPEGFQKQVEGINTQRQKSKDIRIQGHFSALLTRVMD